MVDKKIEEGKLTLKQKIDQFGWQHVNNPELRNQVATSGTGTDILHYATKILEDRFPEAESRLLQVGSASQLGQYFRGKFKGKRWPGLKETLENRLNKKLNKEEKQATENLLFDVVLQEPFNPNFFRWLLDTDLTGRAFRYIKNFNQPINEELLKRMEEKGEKSNIRAYLKGDSWGTDSPEYEKYLIKNRDIDGLESYHHSQKDDSERWPELEKIIEEDILDKGNIYDPDSSKFDAVLSYKEDVDRHSGFFYWPKLEEFLKKELPVARTTMINDLKKGAGPYSEILAYFIKEALRNEKESLELDNELRWFSKFYASRKKEFEELHLDFYKLKERANRYKIMVWDKKISSWLDW